MVRPVVLVVVVALVGVCVCVIMVVVLVVQDQAMRCSAVQPCAASKMFK